MEMLSWRSICVGDFSAMSFFFFLFLVEAFGRFLEDDLVPQIMFLSLLFFYRPFASIGGEELFPSSFPPLLLFCWDQ